MINEKSCLWDNSKGKRLGEEGGGLLIFEQALPLHWQGSKDQQDWDAMLV